MIAGMVLGIIAVSILFVPAANRKINRAANERIAQYSQEAADLRNELAEKDSQVTGARETADASVTKLNEAVAQASAYEQLSAALKAYYEEKEEKAAEALAALDPSYLSEDAKASYNMMANDLRSLLFEKLKESGIAKLDSGDLKGAVNALTRASEINSDSETVMQALTQAKELLAKQQEEEGIVQTIPPQEG